MKQNKIIILVMILVILAMSMFLTGCAEDEEVVKIGLIYPLTGHSSDLGAQHVEGVMFAVDKINDAGGVNGKQIKVYIEDSRGQATEGVNAFNKLTKMDGVEIIFGTLSNVMLAITPLAEESQVILFADSAHPHLTKNKSFVFRHALTSIYISEKMVEFTEEDIGVAAIIFQNNDIGIDFNEEIKKNFNKKYESVKIVSEPYDMAHSDFKTQVQKILIKNPDVIYLMGLGNSYGIWIKQLREFGFDGEIISDFAPVIVPSALDVAGEYAKGLNYANYDEDLVKKYNDLFYEYHGEQSLGAYSFITFGNVELITQAISQVGENTQAIRDYIRNKDSFKGTVEEMNFVGQDILPPFKMYKVE